MRISDWSSDVCSSDLVAVAACRVIEWQGRAQRSSTHLPTIDRSVLLSVLWCTLQGLLAFTIISSGDLVLRVLSATLVMAMIGPICARNYAAPRFAFLLVLICDIPFVTDADRKHTRLQSSHKGATRIPS